MSNTPDKENHELHVVFYTDGGCRPTSRGMGGWGLHGYFYYPIPSKLGTGCKEMMTAEGYMAEKTGKPDITIEEYVDGFGAIPESTNNAAEVTAFIKALEIALAKGATKVFIRADSNYTLEGYSKYMHGWARSNWQRRDGNPIPNCDLWKKLYELSGEIKKHGVEVQCRHVKGHSGHLGNEIADSLATAGVISGFNHYFEEVIQFNEPKGYWSATRGNNRFLTHPFCYFSTQDHVSTHTEDGRRIYYTGKIKRTDLELIGKKISDSSLAICYLQEPDPAMEVMVSAFKSMGEGIHQGLLIGDMSSVLKPDLREQLIRFKDRLLVKDYSNRRVVFGKSDELLGEEAYPPRLSFRLVDTLDQLERMFKSYLSGSTNLVTVTEITDILYERDNSGKSKDKPGVVKLKSSLKPGHQSITVPVNYTRGSGGLGVVDLVLTLDQDIPDRNTLAALADDGIKVTVITWPESEKAIRYATVIEVNGDAAIWAGAYANLKLVAP